MSVSSKDIFFMREAIRLAKKGRYGAHPNPMVGAVLVKNGKIIGRGFHKEFGKEHAEINAIKNTKTAKNAVLYVTLEPCSTWGKTPPCTDAIIKAGIKKVVIGSIDPNHAHSGKSEKILKKAGINVKTGVLKKDCESINYAFNKYMKTKIPYVTLKISQSLDGRIADSEGNSKWISSLQARKEAHKLRAESDAVCVGINTVLKDNPLLNVRYIKVKRQPVIVVVDSKLKIPANSNLFKNEKVLIATTDKANLTKLKNLHRKNVRILVVPSNGNARVNPVKSHSAGVSVSCQDNFTGVNLQNLLTELGKMGISHLLVEGGGELLGSFIVQGLWDRFICFVSPLIIGGKESKNSVVWSDVVNKKNRMLGMKIKIKEVRKIGPDWMFEIIR